jgi:hypothetical protein
MEISMREFDLFLPKWKRSSWQVRLTALQELFDQDLLERIASSDKVEAVRIAAAARLQEVLTEIAKEDSGRLDIRLDAAKRLADKKTCHAIYKSIFLKSYFLDKGQAVLDMISDQSILKELVENENEEVACRAVHKLTDQDALALIARTSKYDYCPMIAVKKVMNHVALAELADN